MGGPQAAVADNNDDAGQHLESTVADRVTPATMRLSDGGRCLLTAHHTAIAGGRRAMAAIR
jgi:hypothetical protein